nr:putative malic acid transport protein [Quercus suber]
MAEMLIRASQMATGGVANALFAIPYRFSGLFAIGCIFFILNMALFIFNVIMISLRFYYYPQTFFDSILHPTESLFVPSALISVATIFVNIVEYGFYHSNREWLAQGMLVLFWVWQLFPPSQFVSRDHPADVQGSSTARWRLSLVAESTS